MWAYTEHSDHEATTELSAAPCTAIASNCQTTVEKEEGKRGVGVHRAYHSTLFASNRQTTIEEGVSAHRTLCSAPFRHCFKPPNNS